MSEPETVICRQQIYELLPEPYWHLTEPGGMLLHNVRLSEGLCPSISTVARMPGLENAVTPYSLRVMSDEKERVWEQVRQAVDPDLPSRKGAIFMLDSEASSMRAMEQWFAAGTRTMIEGRIVRGSKVHRADVRWLDCTEERWEENARRYWRGEMTDDPLVEALVDGAAYFAGWERAPFGLKKGG